MSRTGCSPAARPVSSLSVLHSSSQTSHAERWCAITAHHQCTTLIDDSGKRDCRDIHAGHIGPPAATAAAVIRTSRRNILVIDGALQAVAALLRHRAAMPARLSILRYIPVRRVRAVLMLRVTPVEMLNRDRHQAPDRS